MAEKVDLKEVHKAEREKKLIKPKHYESQIEPIEFIEANNLDFAEGNVIKYVSRYKEKNGKEDLIKALYYLERLIERYDSIESSNKKNYVSMSD